MLTTSQTFKSLLLDREVPLAFVTLNRPEKRNALSLELMEEMTTCLQSIGQDREIRAVVIRANGPAFSAGHDIAEMTGRDINFYRHLFDACVKLMNAVQEIPQPVIAQVQAVATAAGCQLVAACDLAVAAESAWFATPGVRIGLFCSTPMVAVSRAVGRKKAMEMLLTGDRVPAAEALAIGLVNRVVPEEQLDAAVRELANKVANSSPLVVGIGKQAFYRQIDMAQSAAYDYTREVMSLNATTQDAQEGFTAFTEKRKPVWKGL